MTRRRLFGGHRRDSPEQVLKGYAGYLQADALAQYTGLFAAGAVVHVACNARAAAVRRGPGVSSKQAAFSSAGSIFRHGVNEWPSGRKAFAFLVGHPEAEI
jgi:hypothetical protein